MSKIHLTPEDLKTIEAAVQAAEKKTSGEIVPMVVSASHDYWWVHWALSITGWALASGVMVLGLSTWGMPLGQFVLIQATVAAFGFSLAFLSPIKRLLISKNLAARHVHRQSLASFVNQGLQETRDRTGILIYLSLLERRVEILADRGINDKVPQGYWDDQVQTILSGIRKGNLTPALVQVINEVGAKLAEGFPRKEDDTNELGDGVRVGFRPPEGTP